MNAALDTIHAMFSTHGDFLDKKIPDADLDAVLRAAVRAGSSGNAQSYAIVVVEDPEVMRAVSGYAASHMLVFCTDFARNREMAARLGTTYAVDPAWALLTGTTDTVLAAQTAAIAAASLGIGTLISNGVQRGDPRRVYELLDLPVEGCYPVLALYLGYPSSRPAVHSGRLFEPGVVYRGRYRRTPEDIERILEESDRMHCPVNGGYREKGYAHLLEAFFDGPGRRSLTGYDRLRESMARAGFPIGETKAP